MTAPSPVWFITGCRALALDVTNSEQVKSVVAQAASDFDRLDVVVNNAGFGLVGAFEELGVEQIARNFDTNFFGALAVIRAVLPILRAQQSGHIVNISAARSNRELRRIFHLRRDEVGARRPVRIARRRAEAARDQGHHCAARAVSHRLHPALARARGEPYRRLRSHERKARGRQSKPGELEAARYVVLRFPGGRMAENEAKAIQRIKAWFDGQRLTGKGEPKFACTARHGHRPFSVGTR